MNVDARIRQWAWRAGPGERLYILAEADGRGNAAWVDTVITETLAHDPIALGAIMPQLLNDALSDLRENPP